MSEVSCNYLSSRSITLSLKVRLERFIFCVSLLICFTNLRYLITSAWKFSLPLNIAESWSTPHANTSLTYTGKSSPTSIYCSDWTICHSQDYFLDSCKVFNFVDRAQCVWSLRIRRVRSNQQVVLYLISVLNDRLFLLLTRQTAFKTLSHFPAICFRWIS